MIITQEVSSPVVSNITAAPSRFKIKASAKAFKILSGFYSEPILAIPRELGANAWDSHVKAGNTNKMFEVHAPNTLEPWFSVRDFGTGLSPEAIDTIYTTYFESTKTADNDSDGCMGLGSKTPFNYTENFNVTSFYNGKKYIYNCFIDEQGAPNIMRIATVDTTESNGVEIKFGVKISDIGMWVDKITRAYEPFRNRPTIVGAKIEYKPREYIYQGKNWAVRKNNPNDYRVRCNAFMGNYCYPVNSDSIRRTIFNIDKDNGYKIERAMHSGNFDLFFNIGDLEVAPNKEQLQYDENNSTCVAIVNAIKNAIQELKDQVNAKIEVPKSRWEAMYLFNKYNGYNSPYSHVREIVGGEIPIKFNGVKIDHGNENLTSVHKNADTLSQNGLVSNQFVLYTLDSINGRIKRTGTYHPHSESRGVQIFYTNKESIKNARLRHHLRTKYTSGNIPSCFIITDTSSNFEIFNKHKDYFGWDASILTNIDTLPKPPAAARQKRTAGTDEIFCADITEFGKPVQKNSNGPIVYFNKKAATFDSTGTYYYVDFFYSDPVWNNNNVSEFMTNTIKTIVSSNLHTGANVVYGINVKNKNLLKIGKWINVFDLAKTIMLSNKENHEQKLYLSEVRSDFDNVDVIYRLLTRHPSLITNIRNEDTRKMFQSFVKVYGDLLKNDDTINSFIRLFGIRTKKHVDLGIDPKAFKKTLDEKYMGVFDLATDYYSGKLAAVYKLINFIDEKS